MKIPTFSQNSHNDLSYVRSRKGFSIVEVAIAMGVVTLLLTTFLGVFGPAQKNIQRALSTKDANRMKDTLSNEMSILRPTDTDASSFNKAFRMIEGSHTKTKAVLMYQYRADPEDNDNDGILPPFSGTDGIQGKDYIMQTAVRTLGVDNSKIKSELDAIDGSVLVVRMTQLVNYKIDDPANPGDKIIVMGAWAEGATGTGALKAGITDPDNPGTALAVAAYPKAVIAFRAEFFKLSTNKFNFVTGNNWNFTNIGNAVTEANMAIRR
jgi:hypothetical protein